MTSSAGESLGPVRTAGDGSPPPSRPEGGASFPTTHWSIVLNAGADSATQAQLALESLCRAYWYPIYGFVRRQGRAHHEAQDATQEFLARLIASERIAQARRDRGRFRTFLLTALRHFLINEWHRAQAAKRGGGAPHVSLDLPPDAADRFAREPADLALTPEQAFDRNWAVGLVEQVTAELRREYDRSGRGVLFARLVAMLWSEPGDASLAKQAQVLNMSVAALTVARHRLRRRVGARLRLRIAETMADPADVDDELRHLVAALGPGR